jgi:hypothetical protein
MNSPLFAMSASCRFHKKIERALTRPPLGVPNRITARVRLASAASSVSAFCTTRPPMLCAISTSD